VNWQLYGVVEAEKCEEMAKQEEGSQEKPDTESDAVRVVP